MNIYLLGFVLESGSINKGIDELEQLKKEIKLLPLLEKDDFFEVYV